MDDIEKLIKKVQRLLNGGPSENDAYRPVFDFSKLPIYACLSGLVLSDEFELSESLSLRPVYVDIFSSPIMAFGPPPAPNAAHPAPWVPVRGGTLYGAAVELEVRRPLEGFSPSLTVALVASLIRLQVFAPVRASVLANVSFAEMAACPDNAVAVAFESGTKQFGTFKDERATIDAEDLAWLAHCLARAQSLYRVERFTRAFTIYEGAQWSFTIEAATILVWSALETLFDLGKEQHKARAIAKVVSEWITSDRADRDRAYNVVRELYRKRGQAIHAGRSVVTEDFLQTLQIARCAFRRVFISGSIPSK